MIEQAVQREMRAATGGDLVLSGMTRTTGPKRSNSGGIKKIGVKVRPVRDGVLVAATGPAHLVENDIKPHIVTSRHARGGLHPHHEGGQDRQGSVHPRVTTGLSAVRTGRDWRRSSGGPALGQQLRPVHEVVVEGRHPWRNGVRQSRDRAVGVMRLEEVKQIARTFR